MNEIKLILFMVSVSTKVTLTSIPIYTFNTLSSYSITIESYVLNEFPLLYSFCLQLSNVYLYDFEVNVFYVYLDNTCF